MPLYRVKFWWRSVK